MKLTYVVSYPAWNEKLQWHRRTKKFDDRVKANTFIRETNERFIRTRTPAGNRAYLEQMVLTEENIWLGYAL